MYELLLRPQAIRRQTDMVSQLAYVNKEIKTGRMRASKATEKLREMVRTIIMMNHMQNRCRLSICATSVWGHFGMHVRKHEARQTATFNAFIDG